MNKKIKFLLRFSTVALVVGIAAQFYTNYQIDQTISKFPYQLKDQFNINITESNSDFFTRDLTFSLEQAEQKTDFMHTKLTALPLMISAESEFNPTLIKKLNEQLNITIDKNTITSQFSVFSDGLSSRMLTEFRDGTNKSQTLDTELSYDIQSKSIALQTELSGFNYDKLLKITELKGNFLLTTLSDNLYDLISADVKTKKIDINLLDGDNTHIGLVKGHYIIHKKIAEQGYDLNQQLNQQGIYLSNRNTKSDDDKVRAENVAFSINRQGIPSHISLPEQLKQLQSEQFNLTELTKQFFDFVYNNQKMDSKLSVERFILPENEKAILDAKESQFVFASDHQNKQDATLTFNANVKNLTLNQDEDFALSSTNFATENKIAHFNVDDYVAFLIQYLPTSLQNKQAPQKDHPKFLADLTKLAENTHFQLESAVKTQAISVKDQGTADNVQLTYRTDVKKDLLATQYHVSLDKLALNEEQLQFSKLRLDLPTEELLTPHFKQAYLCQFYAAICVTHLSMESYLKTATPYWETPIKVSNATISANLDTYPTASKAMPVNANLSAELPQGYLGILLGNRENSRVKLDMTVAEDMAKGEKPQTDFWQYAVPAVQELFELKDGKYHLDFQLDNGNMLFNGKPFDADLVD
ncbi:hypothetical protein [Lonepinella sp. BR2271]|uniref:hypothetical protein n=1 Tax=Lonepinella sp. BR2271 TaxID=3434550 RepID=UPI003F6DBF5A